MKKYKFSYLLISFLLLTLLLSGCSSDSSFQSFNVTGTITTESLNKPIEGALVSVGYKTDYTNSEGVYLIENIKKGTYTWKVESQEYNNLIEDITIDDNLIVDGQLKLDTVNAVITGTVKVYNSSEEYSLQSMSTSSNDVIKSDNITYQTSTPEFKDNQIIVNFKDEVVADNINKFVNDNNLTKLKKLNLKDNNIYLYQLPNHKSVLEAVELFNKNEFITWSEPNYIMKLSAKPNDPLYKDQWGNRKVNLEPGWDIIKDGRTIKVAVIDSGIIPNHEDLSANIELTEGKDFIDDDSEPIDESTDYSHGTHVSGIIGAVSNNDIGIAGVNSNVEIIPIRIFDTDGYTQTATDIAEAINYAAEKNVDIINMSFGGSQSLTMHEPIKNAYNEDIILIAAAGNDGSDVFYPAKFPETIAIGATDINNNITSYSNTGFELDLVAPGGTSINGILSTNLNETNNMYIQMYGTSMSTPYVSGVASLLLSNRVSPSQIRDRLTSTAVDLGPSGKDSTYGYGLVDAYGALLNKKLKRPYVFAATKENGSINIQSEFIRVNDDNTYKLEEISEDNVIIIAWRDVDEDKNISPGDYYGEYNSGSEINIIENTLFNNIDIDMYYIPQNDSTNIEVMNMTRIERQ